MALTGILLTCGYAGSSKPQNRETSLLGNFRFSENVTNASTPSNSKAPGPDAELGDAVFHMETEAQPLIVAVGSAPDPSAPGANSILFYLKPDQPKTIYVKEGWKISWKLA